MKKDNYKKALVVTNPIAGKGMGIKYLGDMITFFQKKGYISTVYITECENFITKLKSINLKKYDLLIASGGDGTLSNVVEMNYKGEYNIPMVCFPTGTTNDFGHTHNLSNNIDENIKSIEKLKFKKIDIGKFNEHIFLYVAGFGNVVNTSFNTEQSLKKLLGHSAYIITGVKELTNIKEYNIDIKIDNIDYSGKYILVLILNTKFAGGFSLNNYIDDINLTDGQFDIVLVKKPNNLSEYLKFFNMIFGKNKPDYVKVLKGSSIHIKHDEEVYWTLDGEASTPVYDVEITNLHKALNIVVGEIDEQKNK